MVVQGKNSSLILGGRNITIARNAPFQKPLTKNIPISNITAVTFQPASLFSFGYMVISFRGGQVPRMGALSASLNENAVLFSRKQQKDFLQAKEHIEQRIGF